MSRCWQTNAAMTLLALLVSTAYAKDSLRPRRLEPTEHLESEENLTTEFETDDFESETLNFDERNSDQDREQCLSEFESSEEPLETPPAKPKSPFGGSGMMGGGAPGYGVAWYPTARADLAGDSIGFVRQSLQVGYPVWRRDGDAVFLSANLKRTDFFTNAILPDSGNPFPDELSNISLGLGHLHEYANGWSSMVNVGVGSASDHPFHSIDEVNVNLLGVLMVPAANQRDRWLFSVMYSPQGAINFPIPGIAYTWSPSDTFTMNIGLPFSINWKPKDRWVINVTYFPLTNVNARATFQWRERIAFYGGYEWFNEGYFLVDRVNQKDRFFGFEQRLVTGVQWQFMTRLRLDLQGGFAFDRYYGEGDNGLVVSDLRDRVNLTPGAFLGANLSLQF